jgi:hypothetical protein
MYLIQLLRAVQYIRKLAVMGGLNGMVNLRVRAKSNPSSPRTFCAGPLVRIKAELIELDMHPTRLIRAIAGKDSQDDHDKLEEFETAAQIYGKCCKGCWKNIGLICT